MTIMTTKANITIQPEETFNNESVLYNLMTLSEATINKIEFQFAPYKYQGETYVEIVNYEATAKQYASEDDACDAEVISEALSDLLYTLSVSYAYNQVPEEYDLNGLSVTMTAKDGKVDVDLETTYC